MYKCMNNANLVGWCRVLCLGTDSCVTYVWGVGSRADAVLGIRVLHPEKLMQWYVDNIILLLFYIYIYIEI